jgi:hypothetical protein
MKKVSWDFILKWSVKMTDKSYHSGSHQQKIFAMLSELGKEIGFDIEYSKRKQKRMGIDE